MLPSPSVIGLSTCSGNAARYRHRLRVPVSICCRVRPGSGREQKGRLVRPAPARLVERKRRAGARIDVIGQHAPECGRNRGPEASRDHQLSARPAAGSEGCHHGTTRTIQRHDRFHHGHRRTDPRPGRAGQPQFRLQHPSRRPHRAGTAGFEIERIEYTDAAGVPKRVLVAHRGGRGGIAFSGHMDTVPDTGWQDDPWSGRIDGDGVLHGLGSTDMKGPLAAAIVAARALPIPSR